MNTAEILIAMYPDEWNQGLFSLKDDNNGLGIVIDVWNMTIPKPTQEQIDSYEATIIAKFELDQQIRTMTDYVVNKIEKTANERTYSSALSCASYKDSTNPIWAAESTAFIAWRDAMYAYSINIYNDIKNGGTVLTQEQFIAGLPVMIWPT